VVPVDRTGFITVPVHPIASERNEVSQSELAVTAPSQSRLSCVSLRKDLIAWPMLR
jgi:hypothetical protein